MILYPRGFAGLPLLLTCSGSAVPRAIVPGIVCALIALALEINVGHAYLQNLIVHPYPFQVFSGVVSFLLVFRVNAAHARYWESIGHLKRMGAKLGAR